MITSWCGPRWAGLRTTAVLLVTAAVALTSPWLAHPPVTSATPGPATLLVLLLTQAGALEVSRMVSRRRGTAVGTALPSWAVAGALLLPGAGMVAVAVAGQAHLVLRRDGLRGLRRPRGAASSLLSALAAGLVAGVAGPAAGIDLPLSVRGVVALLAAVAAASTAVHVIRLAHTGRWTLPPVAELATMCMGGLLALLWSAGPLSALLAAPALALAQQARLAVPLREQATTDGRTGLLRYESWTVLATSQVERQQTRQRPWAVLFADLDHFKAYNDTHGHLAGDAVLTDVADVLRQSTRSQDLLGRFGGEEFCLLLPDTDADAAAVVAERIRAAVEQTGSQQRHGPLTISVGVAAVDQQTGADLEAALEAADEAVYAAKDAGRNQLVLRRLQVDPAQLGRTAAVAATVGRLGLVTARSVPASDEQTVIRSA